MKFAADLRVRMMWGLLAEDVWDVVYMHTHVGVELAWRRTMEITIGYTRSIVPLVLRDRVDDAVQARELVRPQLPQLDDGQWDSRTWWAVLRRVEASQVLFPHARVWEALWSEETSVYDLVLSEILSDVMNEVGRR